MLGCFCRPNVFSSNGGLPDSGGMSDSASRERCPSGQMVDRTQETVPEKLQAEPSGWNFPAHTE
eukprot:scaffold2902_cov333-Pinguiococcus_pyrenoidosus.AAC.2